MLLGVIMDTLDEFPLLKGMSAEQIKVFGDRCLWRNYEAGETIIDHQELSKEIRFISHGTVRALVRMIEGREVILNDHGQGEFFGHLAAIDDGPRSASILALSNCRICIMPKGVFQEIVETVPEIAWRVMNHLASDIRRLSHRLSEFSFLKAKYRLYAELLRLSRPRTGGQSASHAQHRIISPAPLQSDIADRISSRREIVSRDMKELERMGILERTRGGLVILQPDALENMAAEGWAS